jgi:hypothetical protein
MTTHSRLPGRRRRWTTLNLAAAVLAALALTTSTASAVENHTNGILHGWFPGTSHSDGSAFARAYDGYDSSIRTCKAYNWGNYLGGTSTYTTICSASLRDYGNYTECASYAKVAFPAVFSEHNHTPDDYCASLAAARVAAVEPVGDDPLPEDPALEPDGSGAVTVTNERARGTAAVPAARVYRSKTGLICPEAGRISGGDFGNLDENGQFRALDPTADGACFDPAIHPVGFAVHYRAAIGGQPASAEIFGAAPGATSVTASIGGDVQDLAVGAVGAFVLAVDPADLAGGATLSVTNANGDTSTFEVSAGDLLQ